VIFAPQQIGWHSDRLMFLSNDLENDTLEVYVKGFAQQTVGITDQVSLPRRFAVRQNYPNPFNPTTTIFYELPKTSDVKLVIYNLLGQRVRTLLNDRLEAGRHEIIWDAMNDQGYSVSSGVYIYRFEAGDYTRTLKMILMR
jgi:hypothetical protein